MDKSNKKIEDPDLAKVEPALRRAAARAREIARRTKTPLVIFLQPKSKFSIAEALQKHWS